MAVIKPTAAELGSVNMSFLINCSVIQQPLSPPLHINDIQEELDPNCSVFAASFFEFTESCICNTHH